MTRERLKELLPVMQAWVDEKEVEKYVFVGDAYHDWVPVTKDEHILDLIEKNIGVRIKPETKRVPLGPEDIPAVCWMKHPCHEWAALIVRIYNGGVVIQASRDGLKRTFVDMMEQHMQYSTDRKTWKPCWKEVEE